ncbi:MAG: hypothetical protein CO029_00775 [Candidatus Magasanikbacteria bacterium CG_4_9_14_0_2_um_filter_41_10]|uniref:Methyltransferase FkbM domain-containing protein n=1 Tax=Candidatus Magasanikbacteria bacterium CG_4_10_14_0_2_um_filter_41_31 TaxID=1974639 RepID=A0A2M7V226_9BACT|nr:MAG: hypothetical protein AUJ37_01270 [Candidatus Magasanikbacteria bacterium CG1_02_41_34]PIZ92460.1 MAG: hypothetical protein COX83_04225 [Candidatus Magasanikbacteria bacterium CG_4_10_14_0_2_um_filter_41_31]PJC53837.1 MAG: hypothetical protein CO029_00775 [Candidatus Magasanikbacteria bacterium CG_4_9_14_0_2_um_filter_41_10]
MNRYFVEFENNITSQWGEDGILEEIFRRIGDGTKMAIEFGAWDGKHCSNVWNLWNNKGWSAILIESEEKRVEELKQNIEGFDNVIPVHAFVETEGDNTLDKILGKYLPGKKVDLLCIDVDGDDYHILESIETIKPRVIVIEYNPTVPPHIDIVQAEGEYFGASAKALNRLATDKGYVLVDITSTNMIFVIDDEFQKIDISRQTVDELFDKSLLTYVISGYGGYSFLTRLPRFSNFFQFRRKKKVGLSIRDKDTSCIPVIIRRNESMLAFVSKRFHVPGTKVTWHRVLVRLINKKRELKFRWTHYKKQKTIRAYQKKYDISTMLETGTYKGDMVFKMRNVFKKIYTIELGKKLYEDACVRLKDFSHITLLHGDSGEKITEILTSIKEPTLFWLDGHYSGGETALGNLETPVIAELKSILKHPVKNHVILIDDARCFNGEKDYPTMKELTALVTQFSNYTLEVKNDIIRVVN